MRVIAGSAKGRELEAPKGMSTRPTLAKVKEAMFGMIQFDVPYASVLDMFAGSGALGIEALSRGAKSAVFCDTDRQAVSVVKANLKKLGFEDRARVFQGDAISLASSMQGQGFDIVLLDPPYKTPLASRAIAALDENSLLNDGALIICEHSGDNPPALPKRGFTARAPKKYGDSFVTLITYSKEGQST